MYNYSFIIPHKNCPDLLRRCLGSIPKRDDIQIIIVDDNSDEEKVDFVHFPGYDRPNTICIFNKEGKGAGHARNIALSLATGKWLVFADADDYFTTQLPIVLDKYANDEKIDVVFLNAIGIDEKGNKSFVNVQLYIDNYIKGRKNAENVLRYGCWAPWTRMIKRNIQSSHQVWFEEIPIGNDMMFVITSTLYASSIQVEKNFIYYYFKPTWGSLTSRKWTQDTAIMRLESRMKLNEFYKKINYPYIWPVWPFFYKIKNKKKIRVILRKYKYNLYMDIYHSILRTFAKVKKIL